MAVLDKLPLELSESWRHMDSSQSSATEENQATDKPDKKSLLLIGLTVFIDLIGFGLIIPAMPTYAQQFHADDFTIGLLIAIYSLMQFLFMPFWGRLSDKIGRKPVLLISLCFSCIGYLTWGLSNSLIMLFISRAVAGFGNANLAVAQAYIADVTTKETRAKGMGLVGAAFGLGFVLGPAIGGGVSAAGLSLAHLGFVALGFSLIDLIFTAMWLPEPKKRTSAGAERYPMGLGFYLDTLSDPKLRVSLIIFFMATFAFANMEATLILLTIKNFHFGTFENSMMFTWIGVLMVFVQGRLIHGLSKKYGEKKLITIGALLNVVGLLLTPFSTAVWMLAIALAFLAFGSGLATPANQSLLSKLAPPDRMGGSMGVGQSLSTLGRIIGPALGCYLFQNVGVASPYIVGAAAMLVVVGLSFAVPEA
ncbi:MAG: MFS transporter [Candidatus Melainabacteria bacterium]|nr:MFS transporter [Candidatus Melainabacteria bacterium]